MIESLMKKLSIIIFSINLKFKFDYFHMGKKSTDIIFTDIIFMCNFILGI